MKLIILTPENIILEQEVEEVILPTSEGEITILPNHVAMISTTGLGNVRFKAENSVDQFVSLDKGFVETDGQVVKIFADVAIHSDQYDETKLLEMISDAENLMKNASGDVNIEKLKSQINIFNLHLSSKKRRSI